MSQGGHGGPSGSLPFALITVGTPAEEGPSLPAEQGAGRGPHPAGCGGSGTALPQRGAGQNMAAVLTCWLLVLGQVGILWRPLSPYCRHVCARLRKAACRLRHMAPVLGRALRAPTGSLSSLTEGLGLASVAHKAEAEPRLAPRCSVPMAGATGKLSVTSLSTLCG